MPRLIPIRSIILLAICALLAIPEADAQRRVRKKRPKINRFNAGLVLGLNLSQVDGDGHTGFDKRGLLGGVKGSAYLTKYLDFEIQLLYSQKGSRIKNLIVPGSPRGKKDRILHFDYMEVPFLFSWKLYDPWESVHGYRLELGFSYARLINYRIEENLSPDVVPFEAMTDDFDRNEYNTVIGLGYDINPHISLSLRSVIQVNLTYRNPLLDDENYNDRGAQVSGWSDPNLDTRLLRNYLLSLQIEYTIF